MAPARLYVPVTSAEFDRIRELAAHERRTPAEMAAYLLARAIVTYERHRLPTVDEPFPQLRASATTGQDTDGVST